MSYESHYQACRAEWAPKKREECHHPRAPHPLCQETSMLCHVLHRNLKQFLSLKPFLVQKITYSTWIFLSMWSRRYAAIMSHESWVIARIITTQLPHVSLESMPIISQPHQGAWLIIRCDRTITWYKCIKLSFSSQDYTIGVSISTVKL